MKNKHDVTDQDIEDYLAGKSEESALYQQSEKITAPEHLSFVVKKMARDALKEETTSCGVADKPTAQRFWPVAMAAGVVVAVAVGIFYSTFESPVQKPVIADADNIQTEVAVTQSNDLLEQQVTPESVQQSTQLAETTSSQLTQSEVEQLAAVEPSVEESLPIIKEQPELALVETPQATENNAPRVKPEVKQTPANDVAKETHEIPAHLQGLLQNASVNNQNLNDLPPAEVLKLWSQAQWVEQVKALKTQGNDTLAQKYIEAFPTYFPNQDLQALLTE